MGSKKMIPFYILSILEELTDEDNGLLLSEIIRHINHRFGEDTVSEDKTQTIKKNIEEINEFYYALYDGVEAIQTLNDIRNKNYKRYYLSQRKFDLGEIVYLHDYIVNTSSLPEKAIEDLSQKLLSFLSKTQQQKILEQKISDGSTKTRNQSIYYNREAINRSITNKQNLKFDYYEYNLQKELVKKSRPYPYIVSPYRVISSDGRNYLIAYHISTKGFRIYRLDKIKNLEPNHEYSYHKPTKVDLQEYVKNSPYMHTEKEKIRVKLRCENRILDDVIERFADCRLSEDGPDHFIATIPQTSSLGMKYWILEFTSACEVLEPKELREEVKETLMRALGWYMGD